MNLCFTGADPDEIWPLVRDFHYSGRMPAAVLHAFAWRMPGGLFGDTGEPVAGVLYSGPGNRNWPQDALELSRLVRHPKLSLPLSTFVARSLRWLLAQTRHPFVLSYADSGEGHHGGIYQATGWTYIGISPRDNIGFLAEDGSFVHARNCNAQFGTRSKARIAEIRPNWMPVQGEAKHVYIKPLRRHVRTILRRHNWEALPYPKPKHAACPLDESAPALASDVQPVEAAPL